MSKHNFSIVTPERAISFCYKVLTSKRTARQRILMHGDPGVGKSTIARTLARMLGATLIDIRLLQLDLGALRGLEHIVDTADGKTETHPARPYFLPPYTAPEDITDETPRYLILLDEIGAADDSIRKAAFEMLTDHRVGPHLLGDNVWVMGATNSTEDGTNIYEFDAATADRFLHIKVETQQDILVRHATESKWHYHMISAIKNNGNIISASAEDMSNGFLATPSPRSLEKVSDGLYDYEEGHLDLDDLRIMAEGNLGRSVAQYILDMIEDEAARFDLEHLVNAKPEDRKYPSSPFGVYSLVNAIAAYSTDKEKLDKAMDVVLLMPNDICNIVTEAKTTFIYQVSDRLQQWSLYYKYAQDPRMAPFLVETAELTQAADREFEERQRRAA